MRDEYLLKTCEEQTAAIESLTTSKEQPAASSSAEFFASDIEALTFVLENKRSADKKEKEKKESTGREKKNKKIIVEIGYFVHLNRLYEILHGIFEIDYGSRLRSGFE